MKLLSIEYLFNLKAHFQPQKWNYWIPLELYIMLISYT